MTEIELNKNYIYTFCGGPDEDEITEDYYENGCLSDFVWDNYDWWSSLDGTVVTVLSKDSYGSIKVHLRDENYTAWFVVDSNELSPLTKNPGKTFTDCSCDLAALMVRGCRCGGD